MMCFKKPGIYKIINMINNNTYIGSASGKLGIHGRFADHKKNLRRGTHHNIYLQRSWDKYGEINFDFKVIELCDKNDCIAREQYYIDNLNPIFNICKIAGNTIGLNCEDFMSTQAIASKRAKQSKNISRALKGKKKTSAHAINCGARFFNVYKAILVCSRKRGQSAIYKKGVYTGSWLKKQDCAEHLSINSELIRRCLQGRRQQTCGYIFEYQEAT